MAYATTLALETAEKLELPADKNEALTKLATALTGIASGNVTGYNLDVQADASASAVRAFGYVLQSSGSGAQTVVINGVTAASETHATSDAATSLLLRADIAASTDALVQYVVESSVWQASLAFSTVVAGNYFIVKLTDGRSWKFLAATDFSVSGTDTQDAAAAATAINATAGLNAHVFAYNVSGTLYIHQRRGAAATFSVDSVGSPITTTANAATANIGVSAVAPGVLGNAITLAVTGTGLTASGARLTGGTGGRVANVHYPL